MSRMVWLLLAATWWLSGTAAGGEPVSPWVDLSVTSDGHVASVRIVLRDPPEARITSEVASHHPVSIDYQIRLRSRRRAWWDRRLWRGQLVTRTVFDPVTGRHRCEAVLDGAIIASDDLDTDSAVVEWLVQPPEIRVALPDDLEGKDVRLRARAVFSTSTVWLVFQRSDDTEWTEVPLYADAADPGVSGDG